MTRGRIRRDINGIALAVLLTVWLPLSSMGFIHPSSVWGPRAPSVSRSSPICLRMDFNSNDPFEILGIDEATTDRKVIKRAYKRMALKFHPDVLSTLDSSPDEKKAANDRFAKINWAYSQLSGKNRDDGTYKKKSTGQSTSPSGGWTPPHRRSSSQNNSPSSSSARSDSQSVDWSDFMPKSEDNYDTNGDSFGKIFSDAFAGAATTAVSGAAGSSLFKDFIEFLEGNVDGFGGTGGSDDSELQYLLQRGSKEEVRNELDDTKLVVDQLSRKMRGIETEMFSATAELSETEKYLEKMRLEEIIAELNARQNIVKGYLKRAEERLLKIQIRYKEMKTNNTQREEIKREPTSSSYSSTGSSSSTSKESQTKDRDGDSSWKNEGFGSSRRSSGRRQSTTTNSDENKEQSWKTEGFGSSARRGSRRQEATKPEKQTSYEPASSSSSTSEKGGSNSGSEQSWKTEGFGSSRRSRSQSRDTQSRRTPSDATGESSDRTNRVSTDNSRSSGISSVGTSNASTSSVPPHRRAASSKQTQNDSKRRLREIIVDEEFEKLKRELGL